MPFAPFLETMGVNGMSDDEFVVSEPIEIPEVHLCRRINLKWRHEELTVLLRVLDYISRSLQIEASKWEEQGGGDATHPNPMPTLPPPGLPSNFYSSEYTSQCTTEEVIELRQQPRLELAGIITKLMCVL